MPPSRGPIAIGNYDFRPSGTVAKSIEIAAAAVDAGLPAELWVMRAQGPFLERVPGNVPIVEVGSFSWTKNRTLDLAWCIAAFSRALRRKQPSVFLSGGNHLHLPAKLAIGLSGRRKSLHYGLRASNSSSRPNDAGKMRHPGLSFLDRFKYSGADFIVAVSQELVNEIRQIDPSLDVHCIPNGVDVERVRRLSSQPFHHPFIADGRPLLVAMGRICRQKGFDILIRALAYLPPETGARLLVTGDGSKTEIGKLSALAKSHGVADKVGFIGYQANPFAVMSKADLFVSASRWEGASNALNEALACGIPIVATDCPTGNREALKDGQFGTLVPMEDPNALAEGIMTELLAGRRKDIQLKAIEELDLRICLQKWVELLTCQYEIALPEQHGS